jgi:hypothetical protein
MCFRAERPNVTFSSKGWVEVSTYDRERLPRQRTRVVGLDGSGVRHIEGTISRTGWEELVDHYLPIMWMVLSRRGLDRRAAVEVCEVVWLRFAARRGTADGLPVVAWLIRETNLEVATAAAYHEYRTGYRAHVHTSEATNPEVRVVRLVD